MNPAFIWYWKNRVEREGCGDYFAYAARAYTAHGSGPRLHRRRAQAEFAGRGGSDQDAVFGAGGFGVKRPLRFLVERLDLSDEQVELVAGVLERLKIERAQAAVDLRRTAADLADAFDQAEFALQGAQSAKEGRLEAAGRVQDAVTKALEQLHTALDEAQRAKLAGLIRRGELRI